MSPEVLDRPEEGAGKEVSVPDPDAEVMSDPPAEPEPVDDRLSHRVEGLTCPNCGGSLAVETGLRVVSCKYCQTPLLVTAEVGLRRLAVEPRIGAGEARKLAKNWFRSGMRKDPKLGAKARMAETLLCFLPFYRVEADCVGVALGTELRQRTVGSGKNRRVETYEADVERKVTKSHDRTYPAVNVEEWGIGRVNLVGDPLVPFDPEALRRQGMVFAPTGNEGHVLNKALNQFRGATDPAAGLRRTRFKFLQTLRERLTVIYYPLWVVRYHYQDRAYQVLVDAEDGSLAYGKAPGNDFFRAAMLVGAEAFAMFLATTAIQFAGGSCVGIVIVGGIALSVLAWGWRHFRHGGVVIEGTGVASAAPEPSGTILSNMAGHALRGLRR